MYDINKKTFIERTGLYFSSFYKQRFGVYYVAINDTFHSGKTFPQKHLVSYFPLYSFCAKACDMHTLTSPYKNSPFYMKTLRNNGYLITMKGMQATPKRIPRTVSCFISYDNFFRQSAHCQAHFHVFCFAR